MKHTPSAFWYKVNSPKTNGKEGLKMKILRDVFLLFTLTMLALPTLADVTQSDEDTWLNQRTGDIFSNSELKNMFEFVLPSEDKKNEMTQSTSCKVTCNVPPFIFGDYFSMWDTIGMDGANPGLEWCFGYNCKPGCDSLPQC